jgi:hypothetical protein
MSADSIRILVVGELLSSTSEILRRLGNRGFGSRHVKTLQEARHVLGTFDFQIVLSTELLIDGRGYDLANLISRRSRTLIVSVALSESCLWLPVVYQGVQVLGKRALSVEMLAAELDTLLAMQTGARLRDGIREVAHPHTIVPPAPGPHRAVMARRRYRDHEKEQIEV